MRHVGSSHSGVGHLEAFRSSRGRASGEDFRQYAARAVGVVALRARHARGPTGSPAGTLDGCHRVRDDDLDWLYGRDDRRPSEPEPTRVLPPDVLGAGRPTPPGGQAPYGPRAPPPRAAVRARRRSSPTGSAAAALRAGRRTAAGPAAAGPAAAGSTRSRPVDRRDRPRRRPPKPAKRKRPVRRVLTVLAAVLAALLVWLIAVPVYAWSRIERVDDVPSGRAPRQPARHTPSCWSARTPARA